jgi:regulator of PEP synthase PpsR (kinase-PPPase family)
MRQYHLHLVSDSTGETVIGIARAVTAQFESAEPIEHFWNLVRTERQLNFILDNIAQQKGIVLYTLVDPDLRAHLEERCRLIDVPAVPVLDSALQGMSDFLDMESKAKPGLQHTLNADYFNRIEAMEYAIAHDDGHARRLDKADVVLIGVSRTSKTPTCVYLAGRGFKAANIPFVPGIPLPAELEESQGKPDSPLIVALTEDAERLVHIRRNRLRFLGEDEDTDYVNLEAVATEVNAARRFYARMGWPVVDVTRRSVEETAAEIIKVLNRRALAAEQQPLPTPED